MAGAQGACQPLGLMKTQNSQLAHTDPRQRLAATSVIHLFQQGETSFWADRRLLLLVSLASIFEVT